MPRYTKEMIRYYRVEDLNNFMEEIDTHIIESQNCDLCELYDQGCPNLSRAYDATDQCPDVKSKNIAQKVIERLKLEKDNIYRWGHCACCSKIDQCLSDKLYIAKDNINDDPWGYCENSDF